MCVGVWGWRELWVGAGEAWDSRFKQRWEEMSYHANLPDPLGLKSTPDLIAVRKGNSCDNTTQLIGWYTTQLLAAALCKHLRSNCETAKMNKINISLEKGCYANHPLHRAQFQPISDTLPPRLHSRGAFTPPWQTDSCPPLLGTCEHCCEVGEQH